ncbi:MAG: pyruvate ferredoxin oxidoreductase [Chloroflexi bacterium]|nr:pyruvate ferredoxin oxidoreductase [Chloroflexota bacterium]
MATRVVLSGNGAVAYGARLSRIQVVSAYPITPQSAIPEGLAKAISAGELNGRYLRVESEHSALAGAIGASLVGARAFTATSSVGLELMHEVLGLAAGCRQPIVMAVVNRAILGPWNIWGDQSDMMGTRDQGWLSLCAATVQEALDFVIIAYRIAEDRRVLLPVMVNLDGFFLSHVSEVLSLPDQSQVDAFLPPRALSPVRLDVDEPMVVNTLTPPDEYTEVRYRHSQAIDATCEVIPEVMAEFESHFGRHYAPVECFGPPDSKVVLIGMGSVCGTIHHVLQKYALERAKLVKLTAFRPFPAKQVRAVCRGARVVGVIERSPALGYVGPLTSEVRAALYNLDSPPGVRGFVAGLGGRDISPRTIEKIIQSLLKPESSPDGFRSCWIDVLPDRPL